MVCSFTEPQRQRSRSGDASLRLAPATAERGRGVRLGNACPAGTEVIAGAAFACALHAAEVERRCAHCWSLIGAAVAASASQGEADGSNASRAVTPAQPVQRCGGCSVARYCARSCQASHWRMHRLECECLKHYKSRPRDKHPGYMPTVSIVCKIVLWRMARPLRALRDSLVDPFMRDAPTYVAQQKSRIEKEQVRDGDMWNLFDDWYTRFEHCVSNLEAHTEERKREFFEMSLVVREVTSHACLNAGERQLHATLFPVEWFLQTFARLSCNSFSVSDDELRPIGSSLLPSIAMLNHSCRPNAIATFIWRSCCWRGRRRRKRRHCNNSCCTYSNNSADPTERGTQHFLHRFGPTAISAPDCAAHSVLFHLRLHRMSSHG